MHDNRKCATFAARGVRRGRNAGAEAEEAGAGVAGLPGAGELGELRGGGELAADPGLRPPLLPPLVAARAAWTPLTQPLEAGEVTDGEEDNKAEK